MNRNKIKIGLLVASVVLVSAFTSSALATYYSVLRLTPFFTSNAAWVAATGGQAGGRVNTFIAADTLKIGDVVFLSTLDTVKKSATLANYNTLAGVVVGGQRLSGATAIAASDSGTVVATAGQTVWILRQGRTWVTNDAGGSIAAGIVLMPSTTTAGAVVARTTAIDTNYRAIGKAVIGAAASKFMLVDVNVH